MHEWVSIGIPPYAIDSMLQHMIPCFEWLPKITALSLSKSIIPAVVEKWFRHCVHSFFLVPGSRPCSCGVSERANRPGGGGGGGRSNLTHTNTHSPTHSSAAKLPFGLFFTLSCRHCWVIHCGPRPPHVDSMLQFIYGHSNLFTCLTCSGGRK